MPNLTISVDIKGALAGLKQVREDQIPFATMTALNTMAFAPRGAPLSPLSAQGAIRSLARETFTLRRPQFFDLSIKQTHKATKRELWATLAVDAPGDRDDILAKFETDTEKRPHSGRTVAVPISTRIKRNNQAIIAKRDRPAGYNFRNVGKKVIGDRGTFIVRRADGSGVILQRIAQRQRGRRRQQGPALPSGFRGRGADGRYASIGEARNTDVVALYLLRPRVSIKPTLQFARTAARVVDATWQAHFDQAWAKAMSTAK